MKTDLNIYKYIKTGCFKAVFLSELSHFQPVTYRQFVLISTYVSVFTAGGNLPPIPGVVFVVLLVVIALVLFIVERYKSV